MASNLESPSREGPDTVRAQLIGRSIAGLFWLLIVVLTSWTLYT